MIIRASLIAALSLAAAPAISEPGSVPRETVTPAFRQNYTTIAGDFAMTRSQWLILDASGKQTVVHHHGMEVHRKLADGTWVFFIDHPFGADPSWAVDAPPAAA